MNQNKNKLLKIIMYLFPIVLLLGIVRTFYWILYSGIAVKGDYSNVFYQDLHDKDSINTVCVFVPHPDDEIWLAGLIIKSMIDKGIDVHVIYYTDGLSSMQGERNVEALKSCEVLGVSRDNVHYLGFENMNQFEEKFPTGTRSIDIRDSIKKSIKTTIADINPQLIIASDFDFNRDHRLYSILFDETIGEMLHTKSMDTKTMIWKGFCYNTSYYSVDDYYNDINLLSVTKPQDVQNKIYETDNPGFIWKDRLRVPVSKESLERSEEKNYIMDAIACHVTQHVHTKFLSSVNSDVVFWQRNVDNRFNDAVLNASSGITSYLTDFKFFDTSDIRYSKRYNVQYSNCLWSPKREDLKKCIYATFKSPQILSSIVLYDNPSNIDNVKSVKITINDSTSFEFSSIDSLGGPSIIPIPQIPISNIQIAILEDEGTEPGFVEIEAIPLHHKTVECNKICDNKGNFIYKALIGHEESSFSLTYYSSLNRQCVIQLADSNNVQIRNNTLYFDDKFDTCTVKLIDIESGRCYDTVVLKRISSIQEKFWNIFRRYDNFMLHIGDKIEKNIFVQKVLRLMHYPQGIWK